MKDIWIYLPSIEYWIVPFCPLSISEAWMMWMTPGGKFSGITMWKSGWENSGVLSLSSRIKNRTVAVPERDGVPLSSAWTVKQPKTHKKVIIIRKPLTSEGCNSTYSSSGLRILYWTCNYKFLKTLQISWNKGVKKSLDRVIMVN